jgi:hypothetical protein
MDNVNNNSAGGGLVRLLPRALGSSEDRRRHRQSADAHSRVDSRKEPFTVKVSRKVNNAKERFTRRFGMYGGRHVFPLGLYVDYLV